MAEVLPASGADVTAAENEGKTPLHYSAFNGRKDVVELLLAGKADVNANASDGSTPLDRAAANGKRDVARFLRQQRGYSSAKEVSLKGPVIGAIFTAGCIWIEWVSFNYWSNGGTGGNTSGTIPLWSLGFLVLAGSLFRCVRDIFSELKRRSLIRQQ